MLGAADVIDDPVALFSDITGYGVVVLPIPITFIILLHFTHSPIIDPTIFHIHLPYSQMKIF